MTTIPTYGDYSLPQTSFNSASQKIVSSHEIDKLEKDLFKKHLTFRENLYRVLIENPYDFLKQKIDDYFDNKKIVEEARRRLNESCQAEKTSIDKLKSSREMMSYVDQLAERAYKESLNEYFPSHGNAYEEVSTGNVYMDRDFFESTLKEDIKSGLSKKFKEKCAALSRQAFEASADHAERVKNGELTPL